MFERSNHLELHEVRAKELRQKASLARLAEEAQPKQAKAPFYSPLLANIGEKLVAVGTSLTQRYDKVSLVPDAA